MAKTRGTLYERLIQVLRIQFGGLYESDIKPQSSFADDFLADSFELMQLMLELEKEFDIEIKSEEMEQLTTVQRTLDFLQRRIS